MQQDTSSVVAALGLLAAKFEQEGHPLQALHCLRALQQSRLLPDQQAKARLHFRLHISSCTPFWLPIWGGGLS